jgi:ankyrin repeat protein
MSVFCFIHSCITGDIDSATNSLRSVELELTQEQCDQTFQYTITGGHFDIAKWLLCVKPEINVSANQEYAFQQACTKGYFEIAQWLLSVKPTINISANNGYAFRAACTKGHLEIAQWLHSVNPDIRCDKVDIFEEVCAKGYLPIAQWLDHVYSGTCRSADFSFQEACKNGHLATAQWILLTNPLIYVAEQESAFLWACKNGHLDMAQWLFPFISDAERVIHIGVLYACKNGQFMLVQWLVETTIDMHISFNKAFQVACAEGHLRVALLLLRVIPTIQIDANDDLAFRGACDNHHSGVAQWLQGFFPHRYKLVILIGGIKSYHVTRSLSLSPTDVVTLIQGQDNVLCPVCYDDTKVVELQTNCGHNFCEACITTCFDLRTTCPYCRTEVVHFRKIEIAPFCAKKSNT